MFISRTGEVDEALELGDDVVVPPKAHCLPFCCHFCANPSFDTALSTVEKDKEEEAGGRWSLTLACWARSPSGKREKTKTNVK
jgi:hypothetical protein